MQELQRENMLNEFKLVLGLKSKRNKNTKRKKVVATDRSPPIGIQVTFALSTPAVQAGSIRSHGIQRGRHLPCRRFSTSHRHVGAGWIHEIPHSWSTGDAGIGRRPERRLICIVLTRHCRGAMVLHQPIQ